MIDLFPGAPFNDIVVLDFETRWSSKDYTLSKMTTESYIRDPRFKAFGVSMKRLGHDAPIAQWYSHDELPRIFGTYDWSKTAVVAHNAQFDVGIMEWVYDAHPVFIFDTLSMARALFGTEVGNSLKKLSEAFGLPPKGNAVHSTDGLEELDPETERELAAYCCHDTELASILFSKLLMRTNPYTGHVAGLFPIKELRLIDMTCKMFTRPQLHLDSEMLEEAIDDEQTKREALLQRLGVTDSMLASSEQFGELLRQLNVEPPTKPSPTNPNKLIPALAKSDAKFQALLNSDNDDVAALCEARLKVKSTQERTRAQRFLDISRRGVLPVPLAYYGAATGRWAACLVAETEILVYDRYNGQCKKRIVDVLPDDLVWDGMEFVQHEGVQFSGYQEVITHDGVTGTPDHKVFITEDTSETLASAASRGARIMDAPEPDDRALEAARARVKRLGW